jgi:deoxyuridine 5'-triphosphate nucleotidohydrolase
MQFQNDALQRLQTDAEPSIPAFTPTKLRSSNNQSEEINITSPTPSTQQHQNTMNPPNQQQTPSTTQIPTEEEQYEMTPDQESTSSTQALLQRIDDLTETLQLERDNNSMLMNTLEQVRENKLTPPTNTDIQLNELKQEILQLKQQQTMQYNQPTTNTSDTLAVIKAQQELMTQHMSANTMILKEFGDSMKSLKEATIKSAEAAEKQTAETIASRKQKGPQSSKLPRFSAKENEIFIDWYDDVLCILSLSEWKDIYNAETNDIKEKTSDDNKQLSEHLYSSLRLALNGEAGSIMKGNEHKFRNQGIEFLQSMKPIFHPKWPASNHNTKMIEFFQYFRPSTTSVDTYANKFKRLLRDLRYNGVTVAPEQAKHSFIQGLGSEFIPIRNMSTLPTEFESNDIDTLTASARDHLARVLGNRAIQKQQQQASRPSNPTPSPAPTQAPSPNTPRPPPTNPGPIPPAGSPQRQLQEQEPFQKEIMREIGFRVHTPSRIAYWKSMTQPINCYFHRTNTHTTDQCSRLQRAIQRASSGTAPTSTFVPNPAFCQPTSPQPHSPSPVHPPPPPPPPPRPAPTPPLPPPAARIVASTMVEDVSSESDTDNIVDINNTNFDTDYYPTVSSNVDNSNNLNTKSSTLTFPFVIDSGATDHMCNNRNLFTSIQPASPSQSSVKLGDGTTRCTVQGIGTIRLQIQDNIIELHNTLFVPSLDTSLFSVKQHMKLQGCYTHCESNTCTLAFPTFTINAITDHEIHIFPTKPTSPSEPTFTTISAEPNQAPSRIPYTFQHKANQSVNISSTFKTKPLKYVPKRATPESVGYDLYSPNNTSVPPNSRKLIPLGFTIAIPPGLYGRLAPRSSLATKHLIDVAAGVIDPDYRGEVKILLVNSSQKRFDIKEGDSIGQIIFESAATPAFQVLNSLTETSRGKGGFGSTNPSARPAIIEDEEQTQTTPITTTVNIIPASSASDLDNDPPQIRPQDRPQDTESASTTITLDQLRKLVGYRNTESILPHLKSCFQNNFHISNIDREPILELGEISTIDKSKIPTSPVPLPKRLGDVIHVDIGYGCNAGLNGIKYALFVVDRATRYKYIYPLKSLQDDILPAFQSLVRDMGTTPKTIISDFDHKLMGSKIKNYFTPLGTSIKSAPPRQQHKNGLVERNWRSVVRMARSWLTSALLPSSFWYYAIKRAVEVSNYLPVTLKGQPTTPFELVHHQKPDLRALIPLFSTAYIDHPRTGTTNTATFSSQSLRVILIGRSSTCTSLEFYHPPTKQIISSSVYRLDPTLASGPLFNLHYDGGLFFNTYYNEADSHRPPEFTLNQQVYFQPQANSNSHVPAKVLSVPMPDSSLYTIQRLDNHNIIQIPSTRIQSSNPELLPENDINTRDNSLPSWIKDNAPATLFLDTMTKPKRGLLKLHGDNEWHFHFGRHNKTTPVLLKHFHRDGLQLICQNKLIRGHPPFHKIYEERQSEIFRESVARHISAASLKDLDAPTLLQMHSLSNHDKQLWKQAYDEEYFGLEDLPAWTHITEEQYQALKPTVGKALPTMAISTIKYDENGAPKRCKWRIVALGNLDPYAWTSNDCYAPVMSMTELRLLTSLAIYHKRKLKNGDIKQAFVQAVLPDHEKYVLRPPAGCPNTPKDTYWLLKRTLYGLKRSPRHWFDKATQILAQCGLTPSLHNPCMFTGKPDGIHTLYLGLYVDDLCYFSTSDSCEKAFEDKLQSFTTVDFMGDISHFLGIKFKWKQHADGNITTHMSQQAFSENLISEHGLQDANPTTTPYRTGHPVDSVPHVKLSTQERQRLCQELRTIVGSLLWLSQATRPDLSTIVSMLAHYQANASYGHIRAAKHVIRYIKGTASKGVTFSSLGNTNLQAFMRFPLKKNALLPLTDANWGGQDQGHNRSTIRELERFKTRSISGYIIMFNGPLIWSSKRQKVTARSSAEAEIYATDECVKELLRLKNMFTDLHINHIYMPNDPINVYNDNNACVCWSKATTTKGLRHITIRENAIRESVDNKFIRVLHIEGKTNLADLFTKEMKHASHFVTLRDLVVQDVSCLNSDISTSVHSGERGVLEHTDRPYIRSTP